MALRQQMLLLSYGLNIIKILLFLICLLFHQVGTLRLGIHLL